MRRNHELTNLLVRLAALRRAASASAETIARSATTATGIARRALASAAAPPPSSSPPPPPPAGEHCVGTVLSAEEYRLLSALAPCSSRLATLAAVFDESGDPGAVLRVRELPVPGAQLREGEVLLELEAAPINPSDVNTIQGRYPLRPEPPNAVPGHEGVFRVVAVGSGNRGDGDGGRHLTPGDRVVPLKPALGTWRSSGVFRAQDWHRIPSDLPLAAAATLCVNPPTALGLLEDFVDVRAAAAAGKGGDADSAAVVIAQTGATSAVGQLVAQLARHWGARTFNIVRERDDPKDWEETVAWLQSLGADVVTTERRARADAAASGLPAAALALDCVGGASCAAAARLLAPGGTLVSYGAMSLQPVTVPASLLIFKDVRVRGFWLSGRGREGRLRRREGRREAAAQEGEGQGQGQGEGLQEGEDDDGVLLEARREALDRAAALFLEGVWRPPRTELVPLREAARGVARAREGRTRTKMLLVPDG